MNNTDNNYFINLDNIEQNIKVHKSKDITKNIKEKINNYVIKNTLLHNDLQNELRIKNNTIIDLQKKIKFNERVATELVIKLDNEINKLKNEINELKNQLDKK